MSPQSPNVNVSEESAASSPGASIDLALIERRKIIRPLPMPHVVERDDVEVWALWSEAVAYN